MSVALLGGPVLAARAVSARAGSSRSPVLHDLDLELHAGRATGLVGPSGAGKSTLLRVLLGLQPVLAGEVRWRGRPLPGDRAGRRAWRRSVQYVAQDPLGSLDPRMTVEQTLREPLRCLRVPGDHDARVTRALAQVDLDPSLRARRPRELSGGQAQRVAVARALATGAQVLLADEPVSAVDRPLRTALLDLLDRLRRDEGLAILLVSHDLAAVSRSCQHVLVLDRGRVVETGPPAQLLARPAHPTTRDLVASVLPLDRPAPTPRPSPCLPSGPPSREEPL